MKCAIIVEFISLAERFDLVGDAQRDAIDGLGARLEQITTQVAAGLGGLKALLMCEEFL
ncbi:MAG: hypothetical protein ACYDA5_01810 [Vulcanimicrobiaceae bacterium]